MADFVLTLGDFGFQGKEVPQEIPVGGSQLIATHNLIGGVRVADTLGRADDDIEWSGWILGADAGARIAYLDGYRTAGTELILTWADYRYRVIVREFNARFQRKYQYLYRICCEVIADLTNIASSTIDLSIDDALTADLSTANSLTTSIADSKLSSLMSSLSSAVGAVSSFASATTNTINGVLAPLAAVRSQVSLLIASSSATLSNVATLGGLLHGQDLRLGHAVGSCAFFTRLGHRQASRFGSVEQPGPGPRSARLMASSVVHGVPSWPSRYRIRRRSR